MLKLYLLKQIETPRLIIRPVQLGDEVELNQAINRSLDALLPWMPWANDPSLKTTRDFIEKGVLTRRSKKLGEFAMVVLHKDLQTIIGASGYNERSDYKQRLYEIGYWCDINYQGKGYVTEYTNALTRYALRELNAKTVIIRTNVNNQKSIAVTQRLNFKKEEIKPSVTLANEMDYLFNWDLSKTLCK